MHICVYFHFWQRLLEEKKQQKQRQMGGLYGWGGAWGESLCTGSRATFNLR